MSIIQPAQTVENLVMPPEGQVEETDVVQVSFSGGTSEEQTVTAVAFASTAQGDYVVITSGTGKKFALWLDKDANGTAPTGAAYVAADYKIKCSIVTGNTNAQVASAVNTALHADSHYDASIFTSSVASNVVTIVHNSNYGDITAPARHNTGDSGNGSFVVATTVAGLPPSLNSKYILFSSSGVDYYAWWNVNSQGVDPSVASRTAVPVALTGSETASGIATATAAAIDAVALVNAESDGVVLKIWSDNAHDIKNATAGNSGLSVSIPHQGSAAVETCGGAVDALTMSPSIISAAT